MTFTFSPYISISPYHPKPPNAQVPSQSRPFHLMGTMHIAVCLIVKTGTTPRNSGVPELLNYGTWLHRVWCALVVSPVPDFAEWSFGGSEVRPRSARLSNVLARGGREDGSCQDFSDERS